MTGGGHWLLTPMTGRRAIPSGFANTQVMFQSKSSVSAVTCEGKQAHMRATRKGKNDSIMMAFRSLTLGDAGWPLSTGKTAGSQGQERNIIFKAEAHGGRA